MTLRRMIVGSFAIGLCIALLCSCGGESDDDKNAAALAKDPAGSFRSTCTRFLAAVGKQTPWTIDGEPKDNVEAMTEANAAHDYEEGRHVGTLLVTLTDKGKKTPFRFIFYSVPAYGTWLLRKVHAISGTSAEYETYMGDTDTIYEIGAKLAGYGK